MEKNLIKKSQGFTDKKPPSINNFRVSKRMLNQNFLNKLEKNNRKQNSQKIRIQK